MSKGLGRGLSSLFALYEDDNKDILENKKEADDIVKIEKTKQNTEKTTKNTTNLEILNNADNLLEKYQKKVQPKEPTENIEFVKEKTKLEEKLKTAGEEMYQGATARQISITRLQPNPDQPRKNFNQESLKELAQSIKEHGIIQPIIAVPKDDIYIIIAGERRYRAARLAGLKTVPVIIRDYNEQQRREIALIENLQREDLNPIETAVAIKQLIDNYGFTQDEVAQKIGKSRPVVANSLRLLSLEPEVLTLVEKGKLQPGIARAIITLPREQQILIAKKASDGKMTAREVEKTVQELIRPEIAQAKKSNPLSMELISLREDMQQVFGTKITILGNDKKGRIYFDYYNTDDLDRIYNLVSKLK